MKDFGSIRVHLVSAAPKVHDDNTKCCEPRSCPQSLISKGHQAVSSAGYEFYKSVFPLCSQLPVPAWKDRNCCSQVNRADRMPPCSVYFCESGLQNQIAVVTDFCMSEVGILPCAPGCSPVMLDVAPWHF